MKTAMILCAGFGTRMEGYTKDSPKVMLPIAGKPILEYTVRHLAKLGFYNLIINLHYLPEKITDYFGDGGKFGVSIQYSYEEKPLGTAGAVKKVEHILQSEDDFLVLYGDVICNEDYNKMLFAHCGRASAIATIILHERAKSNSVVEMDDDCKIVKFVERPAQEVKDKKQNWVNSGLYCFSKKILPLIPKGSICDFPKDIFSDLIKNGQIYGFPLASYRCAIDSPERYMKAQSDVPNFFRSL
jgi:mannose-1-phosphate guanylyltransferase